MAPWTVAPLAPLSMEFSRQEYWNELLFPSPGDLPNLGIEHRSPVLQAGFLKSEPSGKLVVKNSPDNTGDIIDKSLIPGLGRLPGGGHGNPLQYHAWRIPWSRSWQASAHRVGHD